MTSTSNPSPQGVATANSVYYPALDGVRAMALAMVFMDHYGGMPILGVGVTLSPTGLGVMGSVFLVPPVATVLPPPTQVWP